MSESIFFLIVGCIAVFFGLVCIIFDEGCGYFLVLAGFIAFILSSEIKEHENKELKEIDTSSYEVYINGTEVDRDLIDISNYKKVTYDYENERVLIAIE